MKNIPLQSTYRQWPYSVRLCFQILLVILITFIVIQCKIILVPLYFSLLLSILILPINNFLEKIGFPRALAAILPVLIAVLTIALIIYLLSIQLVAFLNDIPSIKKHLTEHYQTAQDWIVQRFHISSSQQQALVSNATSDIQDSGIVYITETFFTVTEIFAFLIFSFIYSFLILFYRRTLRHFLFAIFSSSHRENVNAVMMGTKQVIKNYMTGLVIEMIIISGSNTILFLLIGIKYAVFLGIFTGILNIIPFVGIYSGIVFTVLVTLTTPASFGQLLWIVAGLLAIHFVDTNFLMPRVVGSKVKINALVTIVGAVTGGILIGIPGVFFALPTIAILKIIFDRIEGLKPWGILLGAEDEQTGNMAQKIRNKMKIIKPVSEEKRGIPGN